MCNCGVTMKADFDFINVIGNEILRRISCVGDHFRLRKASLSDPRLGNHRPESV